MVKNLVGKIALTATGAGIIALFTYGPKYDIDGSKVRKGLTMFNKIVEYKDGGDKIRYTINRGALGESMIIIVNRKKYYGEDTLVYEEAVKRYNYILGKIDSIETAKKESKLKQKLEEKKAEEEKALWVIRK